jgi:PAS domain-containing protein
MVGLSPHTIRAWERRYRVPTPTRAPNNQRRYTLEDVEALIRMKDAASVRSTSLRLAAAELEQGHLADLLLPSAAGAGARRGRYEPDLWRWAADLLPQLILVLENGGRIADANMAVARAAGMLRSQVRELHFVDMVEPYDRAKAVRAYRSLDGERRGWELNLEIGKLTGLYSFDCWAVDSLGQRLMLLIGRDLAASADGDLRW